MNHGGIYLDTDVVVVNPFDPVMNYSAVIGLEAPGLFCEFHGQSNYIYLYSNKLLNNPSYEQ